MISFIYYLMEVTVCQAAFYLLFHWALKNDSFFQANRAYLLFGTLVSFIIPLLNFEFWNYDVGSSFEGLTFSLLTSMPNVNSMTESTIEQGSTSNWPTIIMSTVVIIYLAGVLLQLSKIAFGLIKVNAFLKENKPGNDNNIIWTQSGPSFFSFWKYIFINKQKLDISEKALKQVMLHEEVHVRQYHTFDIIFMELALAICWFNPLIYKIRNQLIQTHEYIADSQVVLGNIDIDNYARLILQLSVSKKSIPLTHQFSKINIENRIKMLNQPNPSRMKAFKYLFGIPLISVLLVIFSFTEKASPIQNLTPLSLQENRVIGEISWEGNTKYTDEKLNEVLDIKPGDIYNKEIISKQLDYNPDQTTVADLYMDEGHLYFAIILKDTIVDDKVNLKFELHEGNTATVDKIIIKGNDNIETQKILEMMEIKKGDLFSRSKLIASQRNIAKSGYFDEENVGIYPIPHEDFKKVDFEFTVHEIKRD
jgi:beta-lactamase regulating signal transducer with metallopeptidase domain